MTLATLVSPVAGGGIPSSARNPVGGDAGSAFGSLLSRLKADASVTLGSAGASGTSAGATSDAPAGGASVPSGETEGDAGSRQAAPLVGDDGGSEPSAASAATAPVTLGPKLAVSPEVSSLLTLATRAAEHAAASSSVPAASGLDSEAPAGAQGLGRSIGVSADGTAGSAEPSSGRVDRRAVERADRAEAGATAQVPVVGLALAASAIVATPASSGSDGTETSPTTGAGAIPSGTAAAGSPTATDDLGESAALPSSAPTGVDSAIVPDTVTVESHLGFLRGVPGSLPDKRLAGAAASAEREPGSTESAETSAAADQAGTGLATSGDAAPDHVVDAILDASKPTSDEASLLAPNATTAQVSTTPTIAIPPLSAEAGSPVVQQVAAGVSGLASTVLPDEGGLAKSVAPARTMALQLSPAGLGTLTVRLHIAGRALDVQLEASDGSTAALIDRDRDALSSALSGKDYQLQSLSVTTHDATTSGALHAERGHDSGSADAGPSGQFQGDGSAGDRPDGRDPRDAPGRAAPPPNRADAPAMGRGGSSLFV